MNCMSEALHHANHAADSIRGSMSTLNNGSRTSNQGSVKSRLFVLQAEKPAEEDEDEDVMVTSVSRRLLQSGNQIVNIQLQVQALFTTSVALYAQQMAAAAQSGVLVVSIDAGLQLKIMCNTSVQAASQQHQLPSLSSRSKVLPACAIMHRDTIYATTCHAPAHLPIVVCIGGLKSPLHWQVRSSHGSLWLLMHAQSAS